MSVEVRNPKDGVSTLQMIHNYFRRKYHQYFRPEPKRDSRVEGPTLFVRKAQADAIIQRMRGKFT